MGRAMVLHIVHSSGGGSATYDCDRTTSKSVRLLPCKTHKITRKLYMNGCQKSRDSGPKSEQFPAFLSGIRRKKYEFHPGLLQMTSKCTIKTARQLITSRRAWKSIIRSRRWPPGCRHTALWQHSTAPRCSMRHRGPRPGEHSSGRSIGPSDRRRSR